MSWMLRSSSLLSSPPFHDDMAERCRAGVTSAGRVEWKERVSWVLLEGGGMGSIVEAVPELRVEWLDLDPFCGLLDLPVPSELVPDGAVVAVSAVIGGIWDVGVLLQWGSRMMAAPTWP